MNALEQLMTMTTVVADSGDPEVMKQFSPKEATTNPSLILAAAKMPQYARIVDDAVTWAKENHGGKAEKEQLEWAMDRLLVSFGAEILKLIPGRVSTEIDARLSFDSQKSVEKALRLIKMYSELGIQSSRILIKVAATWEGVQAARELESAKHNVHCNLTLVFGVAQAVACAEAGVTLISPFVGRILDWHQQQKQPTPELTLARENGPAYDPGVQSVGAIFRCLKSRSHKTTVMGASFRSVDQVLQLAGVDSLTISPALLAELKSLPASKVARKFDANAQTPSSNPAHNPETPVTESAFRWLLNEDQMASEKLAEGIRKFAADTRTLEAIVSAKLGIQVKN